jgi:Zn-dependent protease with chaperone function
LLRKWLASAEQIRLAGVGFPAFRIRHPFPIIAVVGTIRPRLFIAQHVLSTLSDQELTAAIAHECGHLAARDNLKRLVLRACRGALIIVPCGRKLDRAWAESAECAADEHAAQENPTTALDLASALVKIARMVPAGSHAAMPVAAFLVGNEEARGVNARVGRLLEIASTNSLGRAPNSMLRKILAASLLGSLIVFGVVVAGNAQVLMAVHSLIEQAVRVLS